MPVPEDLQEMYQEGPSRMTPDQPLFGRAQNNDGAPPGFGSLISTTQHQQDGQHLVDPSPYAQASWDADSSLHEETTMSHACSDAQSGPYHGLDSHFQQQQQQYNLSSSTAQSHAAHDGDWPDDRRTVHPDITRNAGIPGQQQDGIRKLSLPQNLGDSAENSESLQGLAWINKVVQESPELSADIISPPPGLTADFRNLSPNGLVPETEKVAAPASTMAPVHEPRQSQYRVTLPKPFGSLIPFPVAEEPAAPAASRAERSHQASAGASGMAQAAPYQQVSPRHPAPVATTHDTQSHGQPSSWLQGILQTLGRASPAPQTGTPLGPPCAAYGQQPISPYGHAHPHTTADFARQHGQHGAAGPYAGTQQQMAPPQAFPGGLYASQAPAGSFHIPHAQYGSQMTPQAHPLFNFHP